MPIETEHVPDGEVPMSLLGVGVEVVLHVGDCDPECCALTEIVSVVQPLFLEQDREVL